MKFKNLKNFIGKIKQKGESVLTEPLSLHITEKTDLVALQYHPVFKSKSYCGNVMVENVDASSAPPSKLEEVDCDVIIGNSKIQSMLGNIKKINTSLIIGDSKVGNMNRLEEVGDSVIIRDSEVIWLNNLKRVKGTLWIEGSDVTWLDNLEEVGFEVKIIDSNISWLNLENISSNIHIINSTIHGIYFEDYQIEEKIIQEDLEA